MPRPGIVQGRAGVAEEQSAYEMMRIIGASPVWESEQLKRARFDHPIRDAADAIDWGTLVERFNASRDPCLAALAALSDESLAEKMPGPFGDPSTRAGLLSTLSFHQAYHTGQLAWPGVQPGRRRRSWLLVRPRPSEDHRFT